jgi:hypothetical protein
VAGRADSEDAGRGEADDGAGRVVAASLRACDLVGPGAHCRVGVAGRLGRTTRFGALPGFGGAGAGG